MPNDSVPEELSARILAFEEIPIIDFAGMLSDENDAKTRVGKAIRKASEEVGFFYICNHGVPETLITQTFELASRFFAMPLEQKLSVHVHQSPNHAGYTPLLAENEDPLYNGDLHESFDVVSELTKNTSPDRGDLNLWPAAMPELHVATEEYFAQIMRLGRQLFAAIALSLDLPEDYFQAYLTRATGVLRFNHYPPQPPVTDGLQIGIGAHTDAECFTVLAQEPGIVALQLWNSKEWITAPPIPGTFVINIGDLMQRWSNDIFKSTRHRAINLSGKPRMSLPFFLGVTYETEVITIPSCITEDRPAKYAPVIAGDYVTDALKRAYGTP